MTSHRKLQDGIAARDAELTRLHHALDAALTTIRHLKLEESAAENIMRMANRIAEIRVVLDETSQKLRASEIAHAQARAKLGKAHEENNRLYAENQYLRAYIEEGGNRVVFNHEGITL